MSAWLRRLTGHCALVAFVATLASPWLTGVHVWWNDDAACGPTELGPRHPAAQIESAQAPPPAGHCLVCHWIRALYGAAPSPTQSTLPLLLSSGVAPVSQTWWFGQAVTAEQPPRAPPATLL